MKRWLSLVPALVAVLLYLDTLGNGLTFDDRGTLELAAKIVRGGSEEFGRALTYASHLIDSALWRSWLPGRHVTNIGLYALATALVTLLARRLSRSETVAFVTGLVFAVHPVHVEAVASIAFRKDVLAIIFVLLTVLLWIAERPSLWMRLGAGLCFLLGLVSKEVAVIGVLPILLLLDWLPRRQQPGAVRVAFRRSAPFIVLGLAAIVVLNRTLHAPEGGGSVFARFEPASIVKITEGKARSYGQVLATSARSYLDVLRLLVVPMRLSADYDTPIQHRLLSPGAIAGLVALGLTLWAMRVAFVRRKDMVLLALAWMFCLYLPASNVVPLTHFFVADRYLMVPSFGVCLLAALGVMAWAGAGGGRWRRTAYVTLGLVLAVFATRTVLRNRDWRSEETLWTAALRTGSGTYRAHYNMANVYAARKEYALAEEHFERALQMYPAAPWARRNLVEILFLQKRYDEAENHLRTLLHYEPGDLQARYSLVRVLVEQGKHAEALAECRTVLQADPEHVGARVLAASSLEHLGQRAAALQAYRDALQVITARVRRGETSEVPANRVEARIHALEQSPPPQSSP